MDCEPKIVILFYLRFSAFACHSNLIKFFHLGTLNFDLYINGPDFNSLLVRTMVIHTTSLNQPSHILTGMCWLANEDLMKTEEGLTEDVRSWALIMAVWARALHKSWGAT